MSNKKIILPLAFPKNLEILRSVRKAVENGNLPPECGAIWLDKGHGGKEVYIKLSFPLPADWRNPQEQDKIERRLKTITKELLQYLKNLAVFSHATLHKTGALGIRDGGRFQGQYQLTVDDVRQGRKFDDSVARSCWPIEYWDPDKGVQLEYLDDNLFYEIPLRSLKPLEHANLWGAGKCLSAEARAQASARVVGVCWAMGDGLGSFLAR